MKFSKLFLSLLMILALLSLTACAGGGGAPAAPADSAAPAPAAAAEGAPATEAAPEGDVTLRLSTWASDADLAHWQRGVDAFVADNAVGVSAVELEVTPWGEYWDKFGTQVASQSQADVFMMVSMESEYYIQNGAMMNLTPYIERDAFDVQDFWEAVTPAYTDAEGNRYCLPYDMSTIGMMANMDLLAAAGVEYPAEPWTPEEFVEIAKRLTITDDAGNITQYGVVDTAFIDWVFYDALLSRGATLLNGAGIPDFASQGAIDLVQYLSDLVHVHKVAPIPETGSGTMADTIFEAGQAAFDMNANPQWVANHKEAMPGVNLDIIPQPWGADTFNGGYTEGGSWAASAHTEYPDAAWAFVAHITSPDLIGAVVADGHLGIPGRVSLEERMLASPNAVAHSSLFFDEIAGCEWQTWPNKTEIIDNFRQFSERSYIGGEPADVVMAELAEQIAPLAAA